jgi:IS30 family transposase
MLCVIDEFTRETLAIRVARKLNSADVIDVLADQFLAPGTLAHIRSDQGPELIAEAVRAWIVGVGARTAYIEKASPWKNGYVESFNGKLRDELLNSETFNTLKEAQVLIEEWRQHYNQIRPHSSLGCRPSAPETVGNGRVAEQLSSRRSGDGLLQFRPDHSMETGQLYIRLWCATRLRR